MTRRPLWFVLALATTFATAEGNSYTDCNALNELSISGLYFGPNAHSPWRYKVNDLSFEDFWGEVGNYQFVVRAADVWNEQAETRPFLYTGATALNDLPLGKALCDQMGIDYSLVKMIAQSDSRGETKRRCIDPETNEATQFLIVLSDKNTSGILHPYSGCDGDSCMNPSYNTYDVSQIFTHEFGHALNLGHPHIISGQPRVEAVMNPDNPGTKRFRDLYWWDQRCSREISGNRYTRAFHTTQNGNGGFGSPALYADSQQWMSQASVGARWVNNTWKFWMTGNETSTQTVIGAPGLAMTDGAISILTQRKPAPRAVVWRETPSTARVFYNSASEEPLYQTYSKHWLQTAWSTDFISWSSGDLKQCNSMTGWLTCTSRSRIYTGHAVTSAFDAINSASVTAWTRQTRDDSANDRHVQVAISFVDNTTVPMPSNLGVQSMIPPAVACHPYAAGGYDCILVFRSESNAIGQIPQVKRFWNYQTLTRYVPSAESASHSLPYGAATNSAVAVWYHTGTAKFWVATRSYVDGQGIRLHYSSDGATWSTVMDTSTFPVKPLELDSGVLTGPTTASHVSLIDQMLMYTKDVP